MYLSGDKKYTNRKKAPAIQGKGIALFPPRISSNSSPIQMLISAERFSQLASDRGYGFFSSLFEPELKRIISLISEYHSLNSSRKPIPSKRMNSLRILREIEMECYKWIGQHPLELSRGIPVEKPYNDLIYPLLNEIEEHIFHEIRIAQLSDVPLWMEGMGKIPAENDVMRTLSHWTDAQNLWRMLVNNDTTLKVFGADASTEEKERSLERTLAQSINPHTGWAGALGQHQELLASQAGWQLATMSLPVARSTSVASASPEASLPPSSATKTDEVKRKPAPVSQGAHYHLPDRKAFNFTQKIQLALSRLMMIPEGRELLAKIAHFGREARVFPPVFLEENKTPGKDGVIRSDISLPRGQKLDLFEEEKLKIEKVKMGKSKRDELLDISFVPRPVPKSDLRVCVKLRDDFAQDKYLFCPSVLPGAGYQNYKYDFSDQTGPVTPYIDYLNLGIYLHAISELHTRKYLFQHQEKHSQGKFENRIRERMGLPTSTDFSTIKEVDFRPLI